MSVFFFSLSVSAYAAQEPTVVVAAAPSASTAAAAPDTTKKPYTVWRVYSGNILRLAEDEKVVLLGVDVPSSEINRKIYNEARRTGLKMEDLRAAGRQAMKYMRTLAQGKRVWVEFDKEQRDSYKRLLGYVYLDDGTFLNAELIKAGYARAVSMQPNEKYKDLFAKLEDEAKQNKKGLWGLGYFQRMENPR